MDDECDARIIPFFDYPQEMRKVIYTANAIESVKMNPRKIFRSRALLTQNFGTPKKWK